MSRAIFKSPLNISQGIVKNIFCNSYKNPSATVWYPWKKKLNFSGNSYILVCFFNYKHVYFRQFYLGPVLFFKKRFKIKIFEIFKILLHLLFCTQDCIYYQSKVHLERVISAKTHTMLAWKADEMRYHGNIAYANTNESFSIRGTPQETFFVWFHRVLKNPFQKLS